MKSYKYLLLIIAACAFTWTYAEEEEHYDEDEWSHEEEMDPAEELEEFWNDERGKELEAFIKKHLPKETMALLKATMGDNPEEAMGWTYHLAEIQEEYTMFQEEDPAFAQTFINFQKHEISTLILSLKLEDRTKRGAASSELEGIKKELRSEVEKAFNLKLDVQAKELEYLKQEVKDLEARLERRKANKDQVIERRFNELSQTNDELDW